MASDAHVNPQSSEAAKSNQSTTTKVFSKWDLAAGLLPALVLTAVFCKYLFDSALQTSNWILILAGIPLMFALRSHPIDGPSAGKRKPIAIALSVACWGIIGLAIATQSETIVPFAFAAIYATWALGRCLSTPWPKVIAWSSMLLCLLLPHSVLQPLNDYCIATAGKLTSLTLDACLVPHFLDSNQLSLDGFAFFVDGSFSHWQTIQVFGAFACLLSIVRHRSFLVALLSVMSAPLWCTLCIWLTSVGVVIGHLAWQRDLSCGWDHTLLRIAIGISVTATLIATESLMATFTAPIPPSNSQTDFVFLTINTLLCWPQPDPAFANPEEMDFDDLEEDASSGLATADGTTRQAMADPDELTIGAAWARLLFDPGLAMQAVVDLFSGWMFSRELVPIAICSVAVILLAIPIGFAIRGSLRPGPELVAFYKLEIAKVPPESDATDPKGSDPARASEIDLASPEVHETNSPYVNLLYRRLLQLGDQDAVTRYMVARHLLAGGKLASAREMMQSIAPATTDGFPAAHAWLAIDMMSNPPREAKETPTERGKIVLHHFEQATKSENMKPAFLALYAQILEQTGNGERALRVLGKAAEKDSSLQVALAAMAARQRKPELLSIVNEEIQERITPRIESKLATVSEFQQLASIKLLTGDPAESLRIAKLGLASYPDDAPLRRLHSESLRFQFKKNVRQDQDGLHVSLELLDAALKADPTNPAISEEVAFILAAGSQATESLREALQKRLANGEATALTHLILANRMLADSAITEAIPHLELAHRQAPNSPVILNNLAMALALSDKTQIQRAEELIALGLKISGPHAELLDTQGEIKLIAGKPVEAITSLESAIGLDRNRIHTRELLVRAYRQAGMEDMASVQERLVKEVKSTVPPTPSPAGSPK